MKTPLSKNLERVEVYELLEQFVKVVCTDNGVLYRIDEDGLVSALLEWRQNTK